MATEGVSTKASTWSPPVTPTNPRLFACVRFPNWPIARRQRRQQTQRAAPPRNVLPLVLTQTTADRQLVVAACDLARAAGVRPAMSLAQARALCPTLTPADHDPARDAKALE